MIYRIASQYLSGYPRLKRIIKFIIVGSLSALISFSVLYSLTEWLRLWYVISAILSFIVSACFNFLVNKFWTFGSASRGLAAYHQLLKFFTVYISGLTINTVLIYAFTEFSGLDYRLSWVVATGLVTFWNFGLSQFWTFRPINEPLNN